MLEALSEAGVDCLFTNYGSDHTAIIEAVATAREQGRPMPRIVTAPVEMVALSAAHGHAQLSGRAQAVLVHVECGTQSLAGAIHNASKGRVPVLILAGASPATQEGELRGSRNEFIQWIQDVADQRGIVRGYVNYDHEIRFGANAKQIVHRALQIAHSDPRGPVYVMATREVLEAETARVEIRTDHWRAVAPAALPSGAAAGIARSLLEARRPLVVTSFVGRNPAAFAELERLCGELAVGVLESVPSYVNYPTTDSLYLGCQWNEQRQNAALAEADLIVVIDSDVPWIPTVSRPRADARIVHIDPDPLKTRIAALVHPGGGVLPRGCGDRACADPRGRERTAERRQRSRHRRATGALRSVARGARARADRRRTAARTDGITPEHLTAAVREAVGEDAVVMSEAVTNFHVVSRHMRRRAPGHAVLERGWFARLVRRCGRGRQARTARCARRRAERRRHRTSSRNPRPCTGWRADTQRRSCRSSTTMAAGRHRAPARWVCIPTARRAAPPISTRNSRPIPITAALPQRRAVHTRGRFHAPRRSARRCRPRSRPCATEQRCAVIDARIVQP